MPDPELRDIKWEPGCTHKFGPQARDEHCTYATRAVTSGALTQPTTATPALKHMDIGSRNQRLRETLEGMGLFVVPIFCESDPQRIDYMHVSADLPSHVRHGVTENPACKTVAAPMASSKIGKVISSAESPGNNVVNFPSVF